MKKRTVALMLACVLIVGCVIGGSLAWLTAKSAEVENVFTTSDINIELLEHAYDPGTNTLKTNVKPVYEVKNYKMVPGFTLPKDPWVTVKAGSEKCYVFVQAVESGGCTVDSTEYVFDDFLKYSVDTSPDSESPWTAGTGFNNTGTVDDAHNGVPIDVYFRVVNKATSDQTFNILGRGGWDYDSDDVEDVSWNEKEVYVRWDVTKGMMNAVEKGEEPTLTFTAYACQFYSSNTVLGDSEDVHYDEDGTKFTPAEAWKLVEPLNP